MKGCWRKKLDHVWTYDKLPICVALALLVFFGYFIHAKITEKEYAFNAIFFDIHTDVSEEALSEDFASYAGIPTHQGMRDTHGRWSGTDTG